MTNKEAALKYLEKGWPIFPVNPADKKPIVEWKLFQDRLPTKEEIEQWWNKYPWANIGLACGKLSGVSVIDLDLNHGGTTDFQDETTPRSQTGNGFHYFYKYEPRAHSQNALLDGLDLKTQGGYIILPPSAHSSGKKYSWIILPFKNEFKLLPEWVFGKQQVKTEAKFDPNLLEGVGEGQRNETAAKVIGKILHGLRPEDWQTIGWQMVRGWNDKNTPPLNEQELFTTFKSIASRELVSRRSRETGDGSFPSLVPPTPWPSPLNEAAYHGIAGRFVKLVEPHSEADPAYLLTGFLTAFGSVIGDKPYIQVERTRHKLKLFVVHVGSTSRGRKGTAWDQVRPIFDYLDPLWSKNIVNGGLATGEGLINAVRDSITKIKDGQEVVLEDGIKDKRLLVIEPEFASVLKVMNREHNILSPILRSAWDRGDLRTLTKTSPLKATGSHISLIGHIVQEELLRCLNSTEMANGFGNRILFFMGKRSKKLPFGGSVPYVELDKLTKELTLIFDRVKIFEEITFNDEARELWIKIYNDLTEEESGIMGSMSARVEPYTLRLACLYALLDGSDQIKIEHLRASIALIDYYYESLVYLFGHISGNPLAESIIDALTSKTDGMSQNDLMDFFQRHKSSEEINLALQDLEKNGRITSGTIQTTGRSATVYNLTSHNSLISQGRNYLKKLDSYINQLGFINKTNDGLGTNTINTSSEKSEISEKSILGKEVLNEPLPY